jgi:hypothetical protein
MMKRTFGRLVMSQTVAFTPYAVTDLRSINKLVGVLPPNQFHIDS